MNDKLWPSLRKSFFAGLLVVVPVAASIGILLWVFNTFTGWLIPMSLRSANGTVPFRFRVVALAVFLFLTVMVGWVTRLVVGRRLVALAEKGIARVPLLNRLYALFKEVSHTVLTGQKTMFRRVVLVPYPHPQIYAIAFVTSESSGEVESKLGRDTVHVFLPASPPAHGFTLLVPREQVIELEMSVADAMKMILSGGAVTPPPPKQVAPVGDAH